MEIERSNLLSLLKELSQYSKFISYKNLGIDEKKMKKELKKMIKKAESGKVLSLFKESEDIDIWE